MKLPVSVIIPTIPSRSEFLHGRCLPSVRDNGDVEIIVVDVPGNGSFKRNVGFARSSKPYILNVDDDSVLAPDCISLMLSELEEYPEASFVYSDYETVVAPGVQTPAPAGVHHPGEFDIQRLRARNYIHTTSMIRRGAAPRWDDSLERFQDWDFWLTASVNQWSGKYIKHVLYQLWQIDESVTSTVKPNPYIEMIVAKHKLNL